MNGRAAFAGAFCLRRLCDVHVETERVSSGPLLSRVGRSVVALGHVASGAQQCRGAGVAAPWLFTRGAWTPGEGAEGRGGDRRMAPPATGDAADRRGAHEGRCARNRPGRLPDLGVQPAERPLPWAGGRGRQGPQLAERGLVPALVEPELLLTAAVGSGYR